ncbi:nuclear elongation and deformation protein 1 [Mycena floridula]|nr:nuclear elongation and deformation protein 1 [Mycena floridula]
MNYIRGAVNAISAPYQYYKELPPINPSTLTGAIDVIVVQKPTDSGGTELVCSPFHVRFGKWQVLRPGEKKVDVSVNGHPIPFNMKIGEAGEAFFIFETDDDVPDNLITSPLLQPTDEVASDPSEQELQPEFLDLDASPESPASGKYGKVKSARPSNQPTPSQIRVHSHTRSVPSVPPTPSTEEPPQSDEVDKRADEALAKVRKEVHVPEVQYTDGYAIDVEGYHSHNRERSDRTIRSSDTLPFPSSSGNNTQSHLIPETFDEETDDDEDDNNVLDFPGPSLRAVSEPPPDFDESSETKVSSSNSQPTLAINATGLQEYSWEWGAFPEPSPMKAVFGKGGRVEVGLGNKDLVGPSTVTWGKTSRKGKGKSRPMLSQVLSEEDDDADHSGGENGVRSRSVPAGVGASPGKRRKHRRLLSEYEANNAQDGRHLSEEFPLNPPQEVEEYGQGGKLSVSKSDPTLFAVTIDRRKAQFELSIISAEESEESVDEDGRRGRRARDGSTGGTSAFSELSGIDDFELARRFDEGKIDFSRFLQDEIVVNDPRLVIRWAGDQYLTRKDESPLMRALVVWRDTYLRRHPPSEVLTRPSSPSSEEDDGKSGDEEPMNPRPTASSSRDNNGAKPPTSSSWVQWWSRSKRNKGDQRPELKGTASAPAPPSTPLVPPLPDKQSFKDFAPAESAPALPSTPVQKPVSMIATRPSEGNLVKRKFIKTLRLTSDQLKSLNLKPGSNTITFALSATGAIACSARIFVWDSTDMVVISDIDGTITKSDALGHVFAMVGRDWTHLGVAKLYTDICRNGYKIMYLTSRAIGQADATRGYLKGIKQNDYQLPEGPVIMSPDRLMASLHREVIMRKPEVFKMACLRDIQRVFGEASRNPFYAGFGNRITDALSYRSVNVPSSRIFTIDSSGEVKLELLELAGYKSSYIHMTDLVDQMFPPIHRKWTPEYTDFSYWKPPMFEYPLPDLSPPSPALSARSDTSNRSTLSRIRNFSLVGSRQSNVPSKLPASTSPERSQELLKMSSFERLSSTLAGFTANGNRRSASPESHSSIADSDDEVSESEFYAGKHQRQRTRSGTSMPGSLEDMQIDEDHEGEDMLELEEGGLGDEDDSEEAFDEDLLAAGEMRNVPFL